MVRVEDNWRVNGVMECLLLPKCGESPSGEQAKKMMNLIPFFSQAPLRLLTGRLLCQCNAHWQQARVPSQTVTVCYTGIMIGPRWAGPGTTVNSLAMTPAWRQGGQAK